MNLQHRFAFLPRKTTAGDEAHRAGPAFAAIALTGPNALLIGPVGATFARGPLVLGQIFDHFPVYNWAQRAACGAKWRSCGTKLGPAAVISALRPGSWRRDSGFVGSVLLGPRATRALSNGRLGPVLISALVYLEKAASAVAAPSSPKPSPATAVPLEPTIQLEPRIQFPVHRCRAWKGPTWPAARLVPLPFVRSQLRDRYPRRRLLVTTRKPGSYQRRGREDRCPRIRNREENWSVLVRPIYRRDAGSAKVRLKVTGETPR
jgi:hypothetical protein